jgi:hypothetical protein
VSWCWECRISRKLSGMILPALPEKLEAGSGLELLMLCRKSGVAGARLVQFTRLSNLFRCSKDSGFMLIFVSLVLIIFNISATLSSRSAAACSGRNGCLRAAMSSTDCTIEPASMSNTHVAKHPTSFFASRAVHLLCAGSCCLCTEDHRKTHTAN